VVRRGGRRVRKFSTSYASVLNTLIFPPQRVCGGLFERCARRDVLVCASFDDVSDRVGKNEAQVQAAETQEDKVALSVTADVVRRRLTEYPTTIEASLSEKLSLSINPFTF
jgi:hypothetical protein